MVIYFTGCKYMQVVQEDLERNGRTFGASRSDDGQGVYNLYIPMTSFGAIFEVIF